MARTLKVQLGAANPGLVHAFRNFGEAVYRALREDYDVSIQEIDAATSEFHVRGIPKREVRTVVGQVRELVRKYPSLEPVNVLELKDALEP